jgi:cell division initiation protein
MIDLTPLEVRKKKTDFRRVMRGYDPALVDDFLDLVADRLDELVRENLALAERATRQEQQVADFRERERALTEALVTAQEMREEIRRQTTREAELARQAAEQETAQLRASTEQEVAQLRATAEQEVAQLRSIAEQEVAQLRSTAEQEVAHLRSGAQQEVAQLRTTAQQEAQELRSSARQERERDEEALRRLRAQQQQFLTSYRGLLDRELTELNVAAQTFGIAQGWSPAGSAGGAAAAEPAAGPDTADAPAAGPATSSGWQELGRAGAGSASSPTPGRGPAAAGAAPAAPAAPAVSAAEAEAEAVPAASAASAAPAAPAAEADATTTAGITGGAPAAAELPPTAAVSPWAARGSMFPDDPLSDEEMEVLERLGVFDDTESGVTAEESAGADVVPGAGDPFEAALLEAEPFGAEPFEPEPFLPDATVAGDDVQESLAAAAEIEAALADAEAAALAGLSLEDEPGVDDELELYDDSGADTGAELPAPVGLGAGAGAPAWQSAPEWSLDGIDLIGSEPHSSEVPLDDLELEEDEDATEILRNAAAAGYRLEDTDAGDELLLEDALPEDGSDEDDDGWLPTLLEDEK